MAKIALICLIVLANAFDKTKLLQKNDPDSEKALNRKLNEGDDSGNNSCEEDGNYILIYYKEGTKLVFGFQDIYEIEKICIDNTQVQNIENISVESAKEVKIYITNAGDMGYISTKYFFSSRI